MLNAEIFVFLLAAVAALVVLANKAHTPYPVVLVLSGLALSFIPHLPRIKLDPDFVLYFLLPALIFPAAIAVSWRDFRRNLRPIFLLAIGLVLTTTFAIGWIAHLLVPSLPWAAACALGAIISPPDAIAATAVIRRLPVPHRIVTILEGESLVNDATALVAFQFAVAAIMTGQFSLGHATLRFVYVALAGIAIGFVVGFIFRALERRLDDPPIEITLSLITPFAAFLAAENLHASGVLAVVTAGIYLGWHGPITLGARTRLQAQAVWAMIVFLLNGFVFVVIGLQLPHILHALSGEPILRLIKEGSLISAAVILVRIVWVIPATYLPRLLFPHIRKREPAPSWRNVAIVGWAGMRGVVSLAAAFALPLALENGRPFPGRSYILFFTFCVILATLVAQGLTLPILIRQLGVTDDGGTDEEERLARLEANKAALRFIEERVANDSVPPDVASRLRAEYDDRLAQLQVCSSEGNRSGRVATPHYQRLQHAALKVERQTIIRLRNEQVINDRALRRIQRDLDLAEARLLGT